MKSVILHRTEKIVAVVPENASGPGWTNRVIWVHIVNYATNEYRHVCLQSAEWSAELCALFDIGALVCEQLRQCFPVQIIEAKLTP